MNRFIVVVGVLLVTGCATSTVTYTPPSVGPVDNSKSVSVPFDQLWDRLVKNLASDFFVINNIEKNSRIINVSFSAQQPSKYVDCGRTYRTFKNARGEQSYSYESADSSSYSLAYGNGAFNVQRGTRLEGRTNIYVAPEGNGSVVTVNTKYVLNIDITAVPLGGGFPSKQSVIADFSTKTPYSNTVGNDTIVCKATGTIERQILKMAD